MAESDHIQKVSYEKLARISIKEWTDVIGEILCYRSDSLLIQWIVMLYFSRCVMK